MKLRLLLSTLALLMCAHVAAYAQIGGGRNTTPQVRTGGDPRVRAALDQVGIKYEIDSDGDYRLILPATGNRTQLVFINSKTEKYANLEVREVWSEVLRNEGPLPASIANKLLRNSFEVKIGAWQTMYSQQRNLYIAVFAAKIAADTDGATLQTVLRSVIDTSDKMELELTGKDDK